MTNKNILKKSMHPISIGFFSLGVYHVITRLPPKYSYFNNNFLIPSFERGLTFLDI